MLSLQNRVLLLKAPRNILAAQSEVVPLPRHRRLAQNKLRDSREQTSGLVVRLNREIVARGGDGTMRSGPIQGTASGYDKEQPAEALIKAGKATPNDLNSRT
jgi:hypothetical protein